MTQRDIKARFEALEAAINDLQATLEEEYATMSHTLTEEAAEAGYALPDIVGQLLGQVTTLKEWHETVWGDMR